MTDPVALVHGDAYKDAVYDFGAFHPLQPIRVQLAVELIEACGLLTAPGVTRLDPRHATREELTAVHDPAYVDAVRALGAAGDVPRGLAGLARAHGFTSADNPVFAGMHEAAALVAGGTIVAAEAIMSGHALHAFAPAGGLHHAHYARAAGFCIYNDPAVAIAAVRARYGARVAYIDVDAHHGDGVQELFYRDPDVLTISLHESGRSLFPGTGFVEELGEGRGFGASVNVPLEPYTTDAPFLRAVRAIVPPLLRAFRPDLIVTQCGCDSHWRDPLTHLATSTAIWPALAALFHDLAHELCAGRWLATGGGGYDLYSVVPRAWTMLFAGMVGATLPEELPAPFLARCRALAAVDRANRNADEDLSPAFLDSDGPALRDDLAARIAAATTRTIDQVREMAFPLLGA